MIKLQAGDNAPDFALADWHGRTVRLADYARRRLILYFYPAALSPGCTVEAKDFNQALPQLIAAGCAVLGVSPDPVDQLRRFATANDLTFDLASDPDHATMIAYGAYGPRNLYGKTINTVLRSTIVLDVAGDGSASVVSAQYQVRASGHVARLQAQLSQLGS
ncbi:MAG: peroxiredoxin [Propionibacteriaceae bacterium]|jgi:peroxiredoxin Q/BCP|nr:peroxiredoxin [Propionibacteriaceae bacterium]